jgi:hypothetical protein
MSIPTRIDLDTAAEHVSAAVSAIERWNRHPGDDTDPAGYIRGGNAAVTAIDEAIRALSAVRGELTGQLHQDENDRARRVDAFLAERRGEKCLHGEDARHRSMYGPPVFVGCGCTQICCVVAEHTAQGGAR